MINDRIQTVLSQFPDIKTLEEAEDCFRYLSILIGSLTSILVDKGIMSKEDVTVMFITSLHLATMKGSKDEIH